MTTGRKRIAAAFAKAKEEGRAALVAYVTAGDPSLAATRAILPALAEAGVDVIELGVPFSDPIADGPILQRAAERAPAAGATLDGVLEVARERAPGGPPIVLFSYLNPLLRMGRERLVAAADGIDGVLLTDLPCDEPEALRDALDEAGFAVPPLLAPTSDERRIRAAARNGSGFAYCIARTGVTGARTRVELEVDELVARVRRRVRLPIAVGFGIGAPDQVRAVAAVADGVVVGSALVEAIAASDDPAAAAKAFLAPLAAATRHREKGPR